MVEDNRPWITITEAARTLGVSHQSVRKRIAKGTIESRRNNRNQIVVRVDSVEGEVDKKLHVQPQPRRVDSVESMAPMVPLSAMTEQAVLHRADVARRLAERDVLHLDTLNRLQAQVAAERSLWLERIDAAELRAERIEQRLDQVLDALLPERRRPSLDPTRPWWRKWW